DIRMCRSASAFPARDVCPVIVWYRSTNAISGSIQNGISSSVSGSVDSGAGAPAPADRKSTRLNSSHVSISYAVFCLKKKKNMNRGHYEKPLRDTSTLDHPHDWGSHWLPLTLVAYSQDISLFCGKSSDGPRYESRRRS